MSAVAADLAKSEDVHNLLGTGSDNRQSVSYSVCRPGLPHPQDVPPPLPPQKEEKARQFPFALDPFQEIACSCLHREESVMVAAHTSAGKTVVAQYAISMALKKNQRVIYTTPVKALSNQKYRDLGAVFDESEQASIGLMTGDVTVNPEASCLVMTTEILRSMLYRGSNELREVSWVVFDEVHYLRDKERGVVWEESIILLPPTIKLVFLSATLPNASEFAQWVSELKQLPCHVVSTDFRPTPLQHYMFPSGGRGLYLLLDRDGKFLEENFIEMMSALEKSENPQGRKRQGKELPDIQKVVSCVVEEGLQPAIVFTFSRKECEALALQLSRNAKLDLTDDNERENIENVYRNAIGTLSDADKELPQIKLILPLLLSGVGVHHSGLLPILREIIEILFQEGVIKVLFATETFALGLNMPAKTCVFSNCRKFDGQEQRWITSGEYIQMAGRAGRRGIDDKGVVITMFDQRLEPGIAKEIICGKPAALDSTFHLGYTMLLNAMRTSGVDPEIIISQSFHQFQHKILVPTINKNIQQLEEESKAIDTTALPGIEEFCRMEQTRSDLHEELSEYVHDPVECLQYLCPGRLVFVTESDRHWGWGVVLGFQKRSKAPPGETLPPPTAADRYVVDILLPGMDNGTEGSQESQAGVALEPCNWKPWLYSAKPLTEIQTAWSPFIVPVLLTTVRKIASIKLYLTSDLRSLAVQERIVHQAYEAVRSFEGSEPPLLHSVLERESVRPEIQSRLKMITSLDERLRQSSWFCTHQKWIVDACMNPSEKATAEMQPQGDEHVSGSHRTISNLEDDEKEEGEAEEGKATTACNDGPSAAIETFTKCKRKLRIEHEIQQLKKKARQSTVHSFKDELRKRMKVLRRLQYASEDNVVTVKGRAACEVPICEDLVLVEMMFKGAFKDVPPEDIAAVVSVQIAEEKDEALSRKQDVRLKPLLKILEETRREVSEVEVAAGLREPGPPDQMNTSFMDLMYTWCKGAEFAQLCEATTLFEGSIIRTMRREAELLRQMVMAAEAIGDNDLQTKFEQTFEALHRGVPFSSSLYI